jgi:hypothetical protein
MRLTCGCLSQINWRLSDEPVGPSADPEEADPEFRANTRCMIFLSFTSNLTSAGVREHIRCVRVQLTAICRGEGIAWLPCLSVEKRSIPVVVSVPMAR